MAGKGWMLVGDAAGFIDPFTGEGIFRALRSARAAAEALSAGDDDEASRRYRAARRQAFAAKDALTWLVQGMLAARPVMGYTLRRLEARPHLAARLGAALGDLRPASDALSPLFLAQGAVAMKSVMQRPDQRPVRAHLPDRRGGRALAGAPAALPLRASPAEPRTASGASRWALGAARSRFDGRRFSARCRTQRRIEFTHTGGVTRGMEVAWRFEPQRGRLAGQHPPRARARMAADRWLRRATGHRSAVHRRHRRPDAATGQGAGGGRLMSGRRVAVTGIGAVTPVGHGADGLWAGVLANRSAVRVIDRFDASQFPSQIAAQVDDFRPEDHLDAKRARRLDRFSQLSVASARMAVGARRMDRCGAPRRAHRRLDRLGAGRRGVRRGAARQLRAAWRAGGGAHTGDRSLRRRGRVQRRHRPWHPGTGRRQRQLVRLGRDGHRAGFPCHPLGHCGRRAGRRRGGAAGAADIRCVRHDPRPLVAQRRPVHCLTTVRRRPRWLRDGRGRRHAGAGGAGTRRRRAGPPSWARWPASARRPTPTT